MFKEITTSCIFTYTCYASNFKIKFVKEHSSFDEYEKELAYFQLNKFLDWYRDQLIDEKMKIKFRFDKTDKKIHWFISNYSDDDEYFNQYLNTVNELINEYHIYDVVNIEAETSWVLTVKLVIDVKKRKRSKKQ